MQDVEIARSVGLETDPRNKSFWRMIAYRMLGLNGETAKEFEKANISVRTVRIEGRGAIRESFPLPPFKFMNLAAEDDWEESELYERFDGTRYFFVAFEESDGSYRFKGAKFWSMPRSDVDGPLRECWENARDRVRSGVKFTKKVQRSGRTVIYNNLPGMSENPVAHVRPHASLSAYKLDDGTVVGDIDKHGDELPDGQWMTKQSFWLNNDYVYEIVKDI